VQIELARLASRMDRARYVARRYAALLKGSVLDVGCGDAALRKLLPSCRYTGIDLAGDADLRLDLDRVERLEFGDAAFDCVVCTDVLEHLENIHRVFRELIRVARRHVILSLPNNWANARRPIERGAGAVGHYGLPAAPPPDRHRWFFSFEEALEFLRANERELAFKIAEVHAVEKPRPLAVRIARRLRYPSQMRYLNRYANSLWALLEKRAVAPQGARPPGG